MKPTTFFTILVIAAGIASLGITPATDGEGDPGLIIRVTSEETNETIEFEAVYIFDFEHGELHKEVMKTPVYLHGGSDYKTYAGIFRKLSGEGDIHVEVLAGGTSPINIATGTFISLTPHGVDVWGF